MQNRTKYITTLAMLAAVAYITVLFIRIPIMPTASFLDYDPKDVIIVIGGFMFGPLAALALSVVVAFIQMVTIGTTGHIGMLMNALASISFTCTAAYIYRRWHNLTGAVVGLAVGCVMVTAVMILWNYIVTPGYMGVPRPIVVSMLVPVFLPFNLIKSGLNAAIAMLLYKHVSVALKAVGLYNPTVYNPVETMGSRKLNIGVMLVSAFVILTFVMIILALQGIV